MKINKYNVEVIMARKCIDLEQLSLDYGASKSSVLHLLRCKRCFPKSAGKLAKALGVDVTEITEPEDKPC